MPKSKSKRKSKDRIYKPDARSQITIKNSSANNNGRHGLSVGYGVKLEVDGFQADGNGGDGIAIQGLEKEAVLHAIRELKNELEKTEGTERLRTLVTESEHEATKPVANKARLTSLIQSAKSVSTTVITVTHKIAGLIEAVMSAINSLKGPTP